MGRPTKGGHQHRLDLSSLPQVVQLKHFSQREEAALNREEATTTISVFNHNHSLSFLDLRLFHLELRRGSSILLGMMVDH